jgi:hypothetical protein
MKGTPVVSLFANFIAENSDQIWNTAHSAITGAHNLPGAIGHFFGNTLHLSDAAKAVGNFAKSTQTDIPQNVAKWFTDQLPHKAIMPLNHVNMMKEMQSNLADMIKLGGNSAVVVGILAHAGIGLAKLGKLFGKKATNQIADAVIDKQFSAVSKSIPFGLGNKLTPLAGKPALHTPGTVNSVFGRVGPGK